MSGRVGGCLQCLVEGEGCVREEGWEQGVGVFEPPARCQKRSWGWFPRGRSCTPSCAPRSWSDLSPAERGSGGGSRGHRVAGRRRASEQQRGGNSQRLQFTRGQQVSEGEEQRLVSCIKKSWQHFQQNISLRMQNQEQILISESPQT